MNYLINVILFFMIIFIHFSIQLDSFIVNEQEKNTIYFNLNVENQKAIEDNGKIYEKQIEQKRKEIWNKISSVKNIDIIESDLDPSYGLSILLLLIEQNYAFVYNMNSNKDSNLKVYLTNHHSFTLILDELHHYYGKSGNINKFIDQYNIYNNHCVIKS